MSAGRRIPMRSDDWLHRSGESVVLGHVGSSSGTTQSSPTEENGDTGDERIKNLANILFEGGTSGLVSAPTADNRVEEEQSLMKEPASENDKDEDKKKTQIPKKKVAKTKPKKTMIGFLTRRFYSCKVEGCAKQGLRAGLCVAHGGDNRRPCAVEGCKTLAARYGLCYTHGGRAPCTVVGCDEFAKKSGFCELHGGVVCNVRGCSTLAVIGWGLCMKHGGYTRCSKEGCTKNALDSQGGMCWIHGPGNRKGCSIEGCDKVANKWGLCRRHGGIARCSEEGCEKACLGGFGLCIDHYNS